MEAKEDQGASALQLPEGWQCTAWELRESWPLAQKPCFDFVLEKANIRRVDLLSPASVGR